MDKLKELMRNNIWTALEDYFRHADSDDVYENISEEFVDRLASDSINSKRALRELFSKSQGWNENLQAIVINGTKDSQPRLQPRSRPRKLHSPPRQIGRRLRQNHFD